MIAPMLRSRRSSLSAACLALSASLAPFAGWAVTLTVGPGRMYATPSAAAAAARDGDVVEIAAGTYRDVAVWRAHNLTIRGVGGFAHLDAAGLTIPNGKAIWVIAGRGYTLERVEFSGARVPDRNGAGIRQEAAGLTVRGCYFHDNENGILTGADAASDIVVETSEFARNGAGDGYSHNLYIGAVRSFTLRGCYSHDAAVGHLVKSRALANYLLYNRITGEAGTDSYEVDLPNGGLAVLVGNVIEQGAATQNPFIVSYAEEGASHPVQRFYMVNNTLVNHRASGTFVRLAGAPAAVLTNNLFLGAGTQLSGAATQSHNLTATAAWFVDAARFDLHLTAGAGAIDTGVDPGPAPAGSAEGVAPTAQYAHPHGLVARAVSGAAIDVGAFEYGAPMGADAGVADVPRDVSPDVSFDAASDPPLGDAGDASSELVPDVAAPDIAAPGDGAASDATADGGAPATTEPGCGCTVTGASSGGGVAQLVVAGLLAAWPRRRRLGPTARAARRGGAPPRPPRSRSPCAG